MNLALQVSENEYLTRSFIEAQRMAELVDALALSSKAMVNTRTKHGTMLRDGSSLGVWSIPVEDDENEMMLRQAR